MKSIHMALAALGAAATIIAMSPETNATGEAEATFEWRTINDALVEADSTDKLILLDVYTDWCGWCKRMDRDTYADSAVGSLIAERFVPAKMNPEKEGTVQYRGQEASQAVFGKALGVDGYPATVFFTSKGERIAVVPGYFRPKEFALLLRFIADEHYKKMTWDDWVTANP